MTNIKTKSKVEGGKLKIVNVNCFRCNFKMEVSDKTDLYEQIGRMLFCPNGCKRPSIQKSYKTI